MLSKGMCVVLAVFGPMLSGVGYAAQHAAYLTNHRLSKEIWKKWMWILGVLLVMLGDAAVYWSYTKLDAVIVIAMGGLLVLSNAVAARVWIPEESLDCDSFFPLWKKKKLIGGFLGCVGGVVFGSLATMTQPEKIDYLPTRLPMWSTMWVITLLWCGIAFFVRLGPGASTSPQVWHAHIGLIAALMAVFDVGIVVTIKVILASHLPIFSLLLVVLWPIRAAVEQRAMAMLDTTRWIPAYFAFSASAALATILGLFIDPLPNLWFLAASILSTLLGVVFFLSQ